MTLPDWAIDIKKRLDSATPGPWEKVSDLPDYGVATTNQPDFHPDPIVTRNRLHRAPWRKNYGCSEMDAEFIAHSPQDIARLLEALEVAMEALDDMQTYSSKCEASSGIPSAAIQEIREIGTSDVT